MSLSASSASSAGSGPVDGEFAFTSEDFRRIAAMLHADAGISLPDSKATLVYSRLAKRLRTLGLRSFRDYCALVSESDGADERVRMLAALTTNVTRFFREPHHFEHLRKSVLPPLLEAARKGGKVRLWSAACSNGQEPYSLALTVLDMMPDAAEFDVKILATDIDPDMVALGRAGVYDETILSPVSQDLRRRWFEPNPGGGMRVAEPLTRIVAFRELNLIGSWPLKGRFDAIMCRNVAIYFADDTQSTLWARFSPLIPPGGTLYIGHSERLSGPAVEAFEPIGITTYRRKGARGRS